MKKYMLLFALSLSLSSFSAIAADEHKEDEGVSKPATAIQAAASSDVWNEIGAGIRDTKAQMRQQKAAAVAAADANDRAMTSLLFKAASAERAARAVQADYKELKGAAVTIVKHATKK